MGLKAIRLLCLFLISGWLNAVVAQDLRAGADGYLLKDMEPEDMIAQLH